MANAHDDDHFSPEVTTPQGTQELGVDFGHEERDVNFRSMLMWFGTLAGLVIVVVGLIWIANQMWSSEADRRDVLPSPMFANAPPPPAPRIQPNPVDSPRAVPLAGEGPETPPGSKADEQKAAQAIGVWGSDGLPKIPGGAAQAVIASGGGSVGNAPAGTPQASVPGIAPNAPAANGLDWPMPSEASGGTMTENRLR